MNNQQLATMAILHGMDLPRLCSASCAMPVLLCGVVMTSLYLVAAISSWHRAAILLPISVSAASISRARARLRYQPGYNHLENVMAGHSGDQPRQAAAHTHQLSHLSSCAHLTLTIALTQNMIAECRAAQSRLVCARHSS